MTEARTLTNNELEAGLGDIRQSPADGGALAMIVRRGAPGERAVLSQGELDLTVGLVGDTWLSRGSRHTPDGQADPTAQLTVMNSRTIDLLAQDEARWPLAGDQLYVDLDLSLDNLPVGSRLAIGSAVIEITATPHTGCKQFAERFGKDAVRFVNSPVGKQLRLRGLNARIVQPGTIRVGDLARKV